MSFTGFGGAFAAGFGAALTPAFTGTTFFAVALAGAGFFFTEAVLVELGFAVFFGALLTAFGALVLGFEDFVFIVNPRTMRARFTLAKARQYNVPPIERQATAALPGDISPFTKRSFVRFFPAAGIEPSISSIGASS
jgi:hypothetical protein